MTYVYEIPAHARIVSSIFVWLRENAGVNGVDWEVAFHPIRVDTITINITNTEVAIQFKLMYPEIIASYTMHN